MKKIILGILICTIVSANAIAQSTISNETPKKSVKPAKTEVKEKEDVKDKADVKPAGKPAHPSKGEIKPTTEVKPTQENSGNTIKPGKGKNKIKRGNNGNHYGQIKNADKPNEASKLKEKNAEKGNMDKADNESEKNKAEAIRESEKNKAEAIRESEKNKAEGKPEGKPNHSSQGEVKPSVTVKPTQENSDNTIKAGKRKNKIKPGNNDKKEIKHNQD